MSSILLDIPREVLVKLYIEQELSIQQLAVLFSVREATMRKALKKHEISRTNSEKRSPTLYQIYQRDAFDRGYSFE